jgi:protein Mpv17
MKALQWYSDLLIQKPIITKCITSWITFGTGDLICQYLENRGKKSPQYDWIRYLRQASFGFLIAPYLHLQFCVIMPYLFPSSKKNAVIKSVLYDQTLGATIFTSAFFGYLDLTSGKKLEQTYQELKVKLLPTLFDNWKIWPFLMFVNFAFVPMKYRVLYSNIFGMLWVAYLSYVQNVKAKNILIKKTH